MDKEENKEIKDQVKELRELLKTIKLDDGESQAHISHINEQLNKFIKKINKNEN
jgi:hypothetical protein